MAACGNKNILFIMPDERKIYKDVTVKVGAFHLPCLAYGILGAIAKQLGFTPLILDLSLYDDSDQILAETLNDFDPALVGFTGTSAIYFHALELAKSVKQIKRECTVIIGGPHASSAVYDTLSEDCFDFVFIGEAENSFADFLQGKPPEEILGIAFKKPDGSIVQTEQAPYLKDLDSYPMPAYDLYDLNDYPISKIHARRSPVLWIETSRGCPFNCKICNKVVHGQTFRPKSPERVVQELQFYNATGVNEFHIADDGFTSNMERAERICDLICEKKLDITWACTNGIRVDRVSLELLRKMRQAGCYRVSFGIESGNQNVLNNLGKKTTLHQVKQAVKWAKQAGIETFGFFMFGFLDDTEETMLDTINLAKQLPLDLAKASLIIPFPGSPLHRQYKELGLLYPPGDYRKYNVYSSPREVYKHPSMDWDIIEKYHEKFYRNFYFNPTYIYRRFISSIRNRTLMASAKAALTMNWFNRK